MLESAVEEGSADEVVLVDGAPAVVALVVEETSGATTLLQRLPLLPPREPMAGAGFQATYTPTMSAPPIRP